MTQALAAAAVTDGDLAVEEAIAGATNWLGGRAPGLVLVFPQGEMSPGALSAQLVAAAPRCPIAGMTSNVAFTERRTVSSGCAAIAFGPELLARVSVATRASRNLREAGRAAAAEATVGLDLRPGHSLVLLFVDPIAGDQAAAIDGAYGVLGGAVPLAGGGADGDVSFMIAGKTVAADAVVAVAISSREPISVGLAHGCRAHGAPTIATLTEGRTVRELDGRPAEEVYLEALSHRSDQIETNTLESVAVLHPLGQGQLRGDIRLRHVMGRADGGGLACATTIPRNAGLWFTEQTPRDDSCERTRGGAGGEGAAKCRAPRRPRLRLRRAKACAR